MKANYAASGLSMDGSPEDVLAECATMAEWDALNIRAAGENRARGYQANADLYGMRASAASQAGTLSAAGQLLDGVAKTYDAYSRVNRPAARFPSTACRADRVSPLAAFN